MQARLIPAIAALLVLAACTPLAPGGAGHGPATAISGAYSAQRIVAARGHDVMVGQVLVLRRGDRIALTAELGQLRHSGQARLRMRGAWRGGAEVPFRPARGSEPFCIGRDDCQGYRTGTFVFTRATFDAALHDGLEATLVGPDAVVTVRYPPAMFAEAIGNARRAGLWP
ncbi:hypothetical protein P6F26_12610 [Roseibacterium sp. SDUM158017]|uniref:hypothetical protein n=1 Tax=Roseicyclus salinarum TaxID=3036773 RepID=UPI0024157CD5|nr:hypothetical protein [Roseibacterium sp. SDUM158017]MDG4649289.1 hypothetical protein [Roseibacterium sp. SDUM158017]